MRKRGLLIFAAGLLAASVAVAQNFPTDNSLTPNAYQAMGVPAVNTPWARPEFDAASSVFDSLATANPTALPRLSSAQSGTVFGRFISSENGNAILGNGKELYMRIQEYAEYYEGSENLLNIYLKPLDKGVLFDDEIAALMAHVFRTTEVMYRMTDTLEKSYEHTPDTKSTNAMRQGVAEITSGGMQMLSKEIPMRGPARLSLATAAAQTFPYLASNLKKDELKKLQKSVHALAMGEGDTAVKIQLAKLDLDLMRIGKK